MNTEAIKKLADFIISSNYTVFFGGAGVSTESGIPDFRSDQGLYAEKSRIPPEEIISRSFFTRNPEMFYTFYKEKMIYPEARPNAAHQALAKLEEMGKVQAVVTQNIDGLHQAAGSKRVLELHGSVLRNFCMTCRKPYDLSHVLASDGPPKCMCGGLVKPDVVLYEEPLDHQVTLSAIREIEKSDLLIIGGTSLTVYPAASYVSLCSGKIVIINKSATAMDRAADLVISSPIGETFAGVMEYIIN